MLDLNTNITSTINWLIHNNGHVCELPVSMCSYIL